MKANEQWLHFSRPYRIIQANALEKVIPALRELEGLIEANRWYAAGFLSYEAAPAFDPALRAERSEDMFVSPNADEARLADFPYLWFGLYPAPRPVSRIENPTYESFPKLSWRPTVDHDTYNAAIDRIKDYIADGRTYQVNYTMRLQAEFRVDPWNFFLHLAQTQNKYAAYIDLGRYVICSASPELFFQLDGDTITGRPMKGTTQRGRTTAEDQEQAQWLKDSEKNRAENVMIVDMIRNDLGRVAKIGSVHVPALFTVERYPTLWQMTSTVTAQTDASITRIFTALFPCASITGAPKVSTMRIISELESTPRNIYTGSIGYIAPDRKARFNVAIRTALIDRQEQTAEYGVGGGIVWDSTSPDEYEEALLKARVLTGPAPEFSLLETMLWTPKEGFYLREKHLARLLDSAAYFDCSTNFRWSSSPVQVGADRDHVSRPPVPKTILISYLDEISSGFTSASVQRVRLLLDQNGNLTSEAKPFQSEEKSKPWKVCLARQPIDSSDVFLFHKTTRRAPYEAARRVADSECGDVLLYNENGELTEFTIGNLVVEMDGKLYTPPISCGLLPGTFRAHLLETGQVTERVVRVEALRDCARVFLVNSVRRWTEVHFT